MTAFRQLLIFCALVPGLAVAANGPADVVQAFNKAITDRKLETATALLAKGSVQYTLRAAHAGVAADPKGITSDLKAHWNTIGSVLYSVTTSYRRVPVITDTRMDGDLATVWAKIDSETVERNGKQRKDSFSEVYLLVRAPAGWLIGAIADNRGTDSLAVTAAGAAPQR